MHFLPIVTRELRVAARRKGTFRMRWMTVLIAIGVSFLFLVFYGISRQANAGSIFFATLSGYTLALCLLAGVFVTADSLSEEKREGTMGLLFLTDLKGYDVVLGKFAATALKTFYALLAIMPVLSLPLLLGGVTGTEFWRMALALCNALFFSLALGTVVSAHSRDAQRAMGQTIAFLLIFVVGLPLADKFLQIAGAYPAFKYITQLNPFHPFLTAFAGTYASGGKYWYPLATSHLLAWLFIFYASWKLPTLWQDRPFKPLFRNRFAQWTTTGRARNQKARAVLLEKNPVTWLMSGSESLRWTVWFLAAAAIIVCVGAFFLGGNEMSFLTPWFAWPILFLFKLLIAVRAPQFFSEARRSGALELLLSTPLTSQQIVHGQWLALKRIFFWPAVMVLAAMLLPGLLQLVAVFSHQPEPLGIFTLFMGLVGTGKFILEIYAVGWFGMWMGLSCKKPSLAPVWTVLVGVLLPLPLIGCCWISFVPDIFMLIYASTRLGKNLRTLSVPGLQAQPIA